MQWLDCRLVFHLTNEGMSESPVEILEKALGSRLISTGSLTFLCQLKRHVDFNASKGDDAWLLLKIDRNKNINVTNGNIPCLPCLTSGGVPIAVQSLEENPEVSLAIREESWRRWTNTCFEGQFPAELENIPQVYAETREKPWNNPSLWDEAQFPCIAWGAIPCSPLNMKGALTSLMDVQRVPKNTVTSLEGPWGHHSNKK